MMRFARVLAILGVLVFSVGARSSAPTFTTSSSTCLPKWGLTSPVSPGGNAYLMDVAAIASNDVWTVGQAQNGGPQVTVTEHWDGSAWQLVPSPNAGSGSLLDAVSADASDDVWAVGSSGNGTGNGSNTLTEHWDGQAWTVVPSPDGSQTGTNGLIGVVSISVNDAWAVGESIDAGALAQTLTEHWDGFSWSVVPSPSVAGEGTFLLDVAAISATDVWAVGEVSPGGGSSQAITEHWDGAAWTLVLPPPSNTTHAAFDAVAAISATDVWAVGGYSDTIPHALIGHWNGSVWKLVRSTYSDPNGDNLTAIAAAGPDDIWGLGNHGSSGLPLIEHWSGRSWDFVPNRAKYSELRNAAAALPGDGEAWSVGYIIRNSAVEVQASQICPIQVTDSGYSLPSYQPRQGDSVAWAVPSTDSASHSVSDSSALQLFDSGLMQPGGSFVFTFFAAGKYPVVDSASGSSMSVLVPMLVSPKRGSVNTTFTLSWASVTAPLGLQYNVQVQTPGSTTWSPLATTASPTGTFLPNAGPGTYSFRAQLQRVSNGSASGWSPPVHITVS